MISVYYCVLYYVYYSLYLSAYLLPVLHCSIIRVKICNNLDS